jgi:hypothetical protein
LGLPLQHKKTDTNAKKKYFVIVGWVFKLWKMIALH